jgi:hypothetical protein
MENRLIMINLKNLFLILLVFCLFAGCGKKAPGVAQREESQKHSIRLIAVFPVENKSSDLTAGRILREMVFDEIYFKGYPKVPFSMIDDKLSKKGQSGSRIAPRMAGELLGVDAVMYCTLLDWKTSYAFYFFAKTSVSARFELRNAKTEEVIWQASHKVNARNFEVTRKRLEMESVLEYEPALREILETAMRTFPNGPDFLEKPSSDREFRKKS